MFSTTEAYSNETNSGVVANSMRRETLASGLWDRAFRQEKTALSVMPVMSKVVSPMNLGVWLSAELNGHKFVTVRDLRVGSVERCAKADPSTTSTESISMHCNPHAKRETLSRGCDPNESQLRYADFKPGYLTTIIGMKERQGMVSLNVICRSVILGP